MGTLVSFFVSLFAVYFVFLFYLLPYCQEYPPSWLLCISIFVRISFNFPAMSQPMDNFFLQSACADGIKKRVVDAVTVVNDFWGSLLKKYMQELFCLHFFLHFKLSYL